MKTGKTLQELAAEIERQYTSKKDYVASTSLMKIEPAMEGGKIGLALGDKGVFPINDLAHDQLAEHVGIPKKYYDRMKAEDPNLLKTNVERWFAKYPAPRMVRLLDGRNRAFLSDKFACYDNYDFAANTLPILAQRKLEIMSCEVTEKRLYIKAVDTKLFRDVPMGYKMGDGSHQLFDTCAPAIILSNSEVGFGRLIVETGVYTRACTNLALFAKGGFKRTHVGVRNKLLEGLEVADLDEVLSQETKRKTMEATWLQVRDVLASAFDETIIAKRIEQLAAAAGAKIEGKIEKVMEIVQERLSLNDDEKDSVFKHLIEGGQLTQYGLHAAVTRSAQDVASYDRATELEYAGGTILELPRTEWARMAEAA